jgi:peptidoglycan lytic transglycosylase G
MTSGNSDWPAGGSVPEPAGYSGRGRHSEEWHTGRPAAQDGYGDWSGGPERHDGTDAYGLTEPYARPAGSLPDWGGQDGYGGQRQGRHSAPDAGASYGNGGWQGAGGSGWPEPNGWPEPSGGPAPYGGSYGGPDPYPPAGAPGYEFGGGYGAQDGYGGQHPYGAGNGGNGSNGTYGGPAPQAQAAGYGDPLAPGGPYAAPDPFRADGAAGYGADSYQASPYDGGPYGGYGETGPAGPAGPYDQSGGYGYGNGTGYAEPDQYSDAGPYRPGDWQATDPYGQGAAAYGPADPYPAAGDYQGPGSYGGGGADPYGAGADPYGALAPYGPIARRELEAGPGDGPAGPQGWGGDEAAADADTSQHVMYGMGTGQGWQPGGPHQDTAGYPGDLGEDGADGRYGGYQQDQDYPGPGDGYASWQDDAAEADQWDDGDGNDQWQRPGDSGLLPQLGTGSRRKRGRARRQRRLRGKAALTVSILVVALVLGVAASFGYERVHKFILDRYGNYPGPGTGTVEVTVPPGASLISLAPLLVRDGVIMATHPFISAANTVSNAGSLQPGVYKLHHHMNAALALHLLLSGKARASDQVTIVEGNRASVIAAVLAKRTGYPVAAFLNIINHPPAALGLPSYAHGRTEGYLFPDTYTLLPKETPLQILKMMVTEFKQKAAKIGLVREAARVNLAPAEVVVIASLVQAEGNGTDFGKISRVIDNRLNRHMLLEFDSTVFYAMGKYGTSVTRAQEQFNSPYNTYLHTGLPPGPIDSPGLAAIQATLHPPHGPWLYFITVNLKTGKTLFTDSLAQLQQWQRQYQH